MAKELFKLGGLGLVAACSLIQNGDQNGDNLMITMGGNDCDCNKAFDGECVMLAIMIMVVG